MLSFAEEILLLALDEERGAIKDFEYMALERALIGAVLMELTFLNRLDADMQTLHVINPAPTGHQVLDQVLTHLAQTTRDLPIRDALRMLSGHASQIRQDALAHLLERGILKQEQNRILWVFAGKRYPVANNQEVKEVKTRLRELIGSGQIPDPRDAVLISLIQSCDLWSEIFTPAEIAAHRERILNLAKLDFIGQSLAQSIRDIGFEIMTPGPCPPITGLGL